MKLVKRAVGTGSVLALLLMGTVLATPASATHVTCGQTITTNTVLDSNVGPCSTGITIGADNITFDLNGFTISCTPASGEGPGILLEGRTGVTVRRGTVTLCDAGVGIDGGSRNTVLGMTLVNNVSDFEDWGDGVAMFRSTDNTVIGNLVQGNGPWSGISTIAANRNTISSNKILDNNASAGNTAGIRLENIGFTGSNANTVTSNQVQGSGTFGIELFAGDSDNVVRGNQATNNPLDGITIFAGGARNVLEGNVAQNNGANGIYVRGAAGNFGAPVNNRILRNAASGNAQFDLRDGTANCGTNVWSGNRGVTGTPPCVFNP